MRRSHSCFAFPHASNGSSQKNLAERLKSFSSSEVVRGLFLKGKRNICGMKMSQCHIMAYQTQRNGKIIYWDFANFCCFLKLLLLPLNWIHEIGKFNCYLPSPILTWKCRFVYYRLMTHKILMFRISWSESMYTYVKIFQNIKFITAYLQFWLR